VKFFDCGCEYRTSYRHRNKRQFQSYSLLLIVSEHLCQKRRLLCIQRDDISSRICPIMVGASSVSFLVIKPKFRFSAGQYSYSTDSTWYSRFTVYSSTVVIMCNVDLVGGRAAGRGPSFLQILGNEMAWWGDWWSPFALLQCGSSFCGRVAIPAGSGRRTTL
jgi:hypothetical protein